MRNIKAEKFLCFIIFFYIAFSLFNCTVIEEDACIYFRCADNINNGYGYVFNKGGERIEVCSSVTWLFLLVLLGKMGFNIVVASKILGIIFGSISLVLIFKITQYFTRKMPWVVLPSLLTAISVPYLMWNQRGLETPLYTLVFLSLIFISLNKSLFSYWPFISFVLVCSRPEGMFVTLGLVPAFFYCRDKKKKIIFAGLVFIVLVLILEAVRFFYFHDFLPSPFYFKVYPEKYKMGAVYLYNCFKHYYLYYLIFPILVVMLKKWNWSMERTILFGFMALHIIWVILEGWDPKPFYRHVVPVIPIIYIYTITGIVRDCSDFTFRKKFLVGSYVALFAFASLFLSPVQTSVFSTFKPNFMANRMLDFLKMPKTYISFCLERLSDPLKYDSTNARDRQVLLGEFIRRNYPAGSTFVYDQMGRAPYRAGIDYYFIDSLGLADKKIAHTLFSYKCQSSQILRFYNRISGYITKRVFPETKFYYTNRELLDYIFEKNPDGILSVTFVKSMIINLLSTDARFKSNYRLKYFIYGNLFFEKIRSVSRPLYIPEGLSVVYGDDLQWLIKTNKRIMRNPLAKAMLSE